MKIIQLTDLTRSRALWYYEIRDCNIDLCMRSTIFGGSKWNPNSFYYCNLQSLMDKKDNNSKMCLSLHSFIWRTNELKGSMYRNLDPPLPPLPLKSETPYISKIFTFFSVHKPYGFIPIASFLSRISEIRQGARTWKSNEMEPSSHEIGITIWKSHRRVLAIPVSWRPFQDTVWVFLNDFEDIFEKRPKLVIRTLIYLDFCQIWLPVRHILHSCG